jgi:hypothetical protein
MSNSKSRTQKENKELFFQEINSFLEKTTEYVHLGINPGDYYSAIWTRDASYILKDQFLTGDTYNVFRALYFVWAHQIDEDDNQGIIYGRGSPELGFSIHHAERKEKKRFKGALPSTIYHNQGFSEVYGRSPDIDSTALMISTTAWILDVYLKAGLYSYYENLSEWASALDPPNPSFPPPESTKPLSSADYNKQQLFDLAEQEGRPSLSYGQISPPLKVISRPPELIEFVVPRMLDAVHHLASRDIDNDGLLEQGYNEDWMDTALRAGKIVYSQACWILALSNLSSLLFEIGENVLARSMAATAERAMDAVESNLWSQEHGAYIDHNVTWIGQKDSRKSGNDETSSGKDSEILTQDVSLYLVSITENTFNDVLGMRFKGNGDKTAAKKTDRKKLRQGKALLRIPRKSIQHRATSTLEAIKERIWMDNGWPMVTEKELRRTGPWILKRNQYHNQTFWPWITGIEMLARSRFGRYQECNELLLGLTGESRTQTLAYYEWVNPKTGKGDGAFPFRTGISTIRIALTDILLSNV